jgi:photosystem II stability/assembly factor-like uncharacterized protein
MRSRRLLTALSVALATALSAGAVAAHDASGWGGLFRTRDAGANWQLVNTGSFVSGALALAVSPADSHHLLMGTDTGVSRSRNGGRDWTVEARDVFAGPAFGVVFDADGQRALIAASAAVFRSDGNLWRRVSVPSGSMPVRAVVAGGVRGRVYLAGQRGLFRSDDWGQSWSSIGGALQTSYANAITISRERPDAVYVVAGGRAWASSDAGRHWESRSTGLPPRGVEALTLDPLEPARLWSVAEDQIFRSDDSGRSWRPVGRPVPERPILARALAVVPGAIVIATERGVYRSADDGASWTLGGEALPAHLEAGMLARDPAEPATVYAGFAVRSRDLLAALAIKESAAASRVTLIWVVCGFGALAVVLLAGVAGLRRFARPPRTARPMVSP